MSTISTATNNSTTPHRLLVRVSPMRRTAPGQVGANRLRAASAGLLFAVAAAVGAEAGAAGGNPAAGASAWVQAHHPVDGAPARSCASCHTADLTQPGRHAKTGKPIAPLAPSIKPDRLTDAAKVEKWLGRNCRWTLGRDCLDTEKADFLAYIRSQ